MSSEVITEETLTHMVETASAMLTQNGDGDNHTVAASIYAADGSVYSGLNLYHFTGGPCAEVVALARLVSEGGGKPLAIVAVADRNRGVVAPCGRCRQILADYCLDIQVVLKAESGLVVRLLTDLLPMTYIWAEQQ